MTHRVRTSSRTKPCVACGRTIVWRKAWERDWDQVKYCSQRCRRNGVHDVDVALEAALLALLDAAPRGAHVSVDQAAASVAATSSGSDERSLKEPARAAARRLVARGEVEIVQGGHVMDPSTARGPIDVRRPRT